MSDTDIQNEEVENEEEFKSKEDKRIELLEKSIINKREHGDLSAEQISLFEFIINSKIKAVKPNKYNETISLTISKEQKDFLEFIAEYYNVPKSEIIRRYIDADIKKWNNRKNKIEE